MLKLVRSVHPRGIGYSSGEAYPRGQCAVSSRSVVHVKGRADSKAHPGGRCRALRAR